MHCVLLDSLYFLRVVLFALRSVFSHWLSNGNFFARFSAVVREDISTTRKVGLQELMS